jgi:hypothetical protein
LVVSCNDKHIAEHLNHIILTLTEGINGFLLCIEAGRLSEISSRLVECLAKHFPDFYKRTILVITHADKIWINNQTSKEWLSEQTLWPHIFMLPVLYCVVYQRPKSFLLYY